MFQGQPDATQIRNASRTTTGTLITIPAGHWFTGNISLTAGVAVAGTSSPTVTTAGADVSPVAGSILARLDVTGLLSSAAAGANDTEVIVKAPVDNDVTLQFTAGASGASSATVNGWVFS